MTTDLPPAAQRILDSLPADLPRPKSSVQDSSHGDDCVSLWWELGTNAAAVTLYLRPGGVSRLSYALEGPNWNVHGSEPLTDRLPDSLVLLLRRVLGVPEKQMQVEHSGSLVTVIPGQVT